MLNFKQNEEAVSPVIGTILMVAITVILAAVIAAFVFGMTGNLSGNKNVAATASVTDDGDAKSIYITYQGGPDASLVEGLNYTLDEAAPMDFGSTDVGAVQKVSGDRGEKNHVVVTAKFTDGASQVILDTFV